MSNNYYISDLLESLDLSNEMTKNFIPLPYPGTTSCFRYGKDRYGKNTKFLHLVAINKDTHPCPICGASDHHESKGRRKISLTHIANGHQRFIIEVEFRRYICKHCHHYFKDDIPFKFKDTMMTHTAALACIIQLRENTAMSVISRMMGVSKSSVYRLFHNHISIPHRFYHLSSVISIDEFRATTDKGTYAFNIVNPITGKTLDIVEDRKYSTLRSYFLRFPYKERKKVKIIIMDLSNAFRSIMHSLFPNAKIVADRFHYVRIFAECLRKCRLDTCASLNNDALSKSIKRNLRLFDMYRKNLDDKKEWFDRNLKKTFTSKTYIEYIFEQDGTEEFYECYKIYQNLLKLIHGRHKDYKSELNKWLDHIFDTNNTYYLSSAKNIRKNWFLPVLRSLTFTATYIRKNKKYNKKYQKNLYI